MKDGRKTVTAAGTREPIAGGSFPFSSVVLTGLRSNTDIVVIGGDTVIASASTRRGKPLSAGEPVTISADPGAKLNLHDFWIDSVVSGDGVTYAYLP